MAGDVVRQFNWVDIFLLILIFRIVYVAVKNGFFTEFFKLAGAFTATYVSLHYYISLADYSRKALPYLESIDLQFVDFICFALLAALTYLVFALGRMGISKIAKAETIPVLSRWGGLLICSGRAVLICGLVCYGLAISSITYFKDCARSSYFGSRFFWVAPAVYHAAWGAVMSKLMPSESANPALAEIENQFNLESGVEGKQEESPR